MGFYRFFACVLLVTGSVASSGIASAESPASTTATSASETGADLQTEARARDAFQRGRIHYDNGDFARAALAFEEAYSLSNRHALLYNLYLAYRDANQQENAARALSNYLDLVDAIENRPQLEARLKALEEGLAKLQEEEAEKAKQDQAAPSTQASPSHQVDLTKPARWWIMPVAVMGTGAALMAASVATGVMALSKQQQLDDECVGGVCDPSLRGTADSGRTLAIVTDVLLFGGAATAATGAVLLFLKKPKAESAPAKTSTNVHCSTRSCGASLSVRF